jgi:site-specific DNA-methyltransferase (adenine-specific)
MFELKHGDCLDVLRTMADNSIDAIVTDPPYGLSFMGKRWDYDVPDEAVWRECLRVLKPGGHLLAFAGTRTQHRMAVRIEDAGFEIRDMIAWVYGSGFPKSLDVSKAIDKVAGAEREVVGVAGKSGSARNSMGGDFAGGEYMSTAPATPAAKEWAGWGTALKPALEPITVARKPIVGTVANNVLTWGTGGVNVDGCRVGTDKNVPGAVKTGRPIMAESWLKKHGHGSGYGPREMDQSGMNPNLGRFPANLIHDGSDEVVGLFPETGKSSNRDSRGRVHQAFTDDARQSIRDDVHEGYGDSGSASRFFYCAKASKRDRDEGCEGMEERKARRYGEQAQGPSPQQTPRTSVNQRNHHPTVKPTDLMRYLCRLVTPPGGTVLDPFMGSGSTGKAAILEGFRFIGIDREAEYLDIAQARIEHAAKTMPLFTGQE